MAKKSASSAKKPASPGKAKKAASKVAKPFEIERYPPPDHKEQDPVELLYYCAQTLYRIFVELEDLNRAASETNTHLDSVDRSISAIEEKLFEISAEIEVKGDMT